MRDEIAACGVVLSELAPGMKTVRWRFAERNRLIADLAHVVVVVESHLGGGAMLTADAALAGHES